MISGDYFFMKTNTSMLILWFVRKARTEIIGISSRLSSGSSLSSSLRILISIRNAGSG
jgi:hypothetical protein